MLPESITALWLRIKTLVRRQQLDRDLEDELQFHLAMREQKLAESGVTAEEARYAARREFHNATRAKGTFPPRPEWQGSFTMTPNRYSVPAGLTGATSKYARPKTKLPDHSLQRPFFARASRLIANPHPEHAHASATTAEAGT